MTEEAVPSIRVEWTRRVMSAALDGFTAREREAFLARLGEAHRTEIERQPSLAWLRVEVHIAMLDALEIAVGQERAGAILRRSSVMSFEGKLLESLSKGVARSMGRRALPWVFPTGWAAVCRALGKPVIEQSSDEEHSWTLVTIAGVPRVIERSASLRRSLGHTLFALMEYGGIEGGEVVEQLTEPGTLRFKMTSPRRDG